MIQRMSDANKISFMDIKKEESPVISPIQNKENYMPKAKKLSSRDNGMKTDQHICSARTGVISDTGGPTKYTKAESSNTVWDTSKISRSSNELKKEAKNIEKNVTSKLDQHSGYECNRFGKPICDRLGIAIDFIVEDENMFEVAQWIAANCEFDRIHFYGNDRPLHVSVGHENSKQVALMFVRESSKRRLPQSMHAEEFLALSPDDLIYTFR